MPEVVKISEKLFCTRDLFSESSSLLFEIRPPQRRFKWKDQQVDQLWRDILNAYNANRDSYFLGTLLQVPLDGGSRVSVIDGQQRITTLSILLAILRDNCSNFPDDLSERASGIQKLISRVNNDGESVGLVVTLQNPDNQTYTKLVRKNGSTNCSIENNSLLARATIRLKKHVAEHINVSSPIECLRDLCEYVQMNVKFLVIEVRNESEGHLVFDTTNTRGMNLSPSEALKARLATVAARENNELSEELIKTWDEVAGKLESAGLGVDVMDNYLHAVWCARKGYTPKNSLSGLDAKFNEDYRLRDFVEDMESYSASYLAVAAPSGNSSLTQDLNDLKGLNIQSYSFLTMVHKHSPTNFEEALCLVLSLQIRNITLGGLQANAYERRWPEWARLVREGQSIKAFDEIREHMVSDEEFQRAFEKAEVAVSRTARHLLRRLDPVSHPGSGVQPTDNVDIEHVLPKSVVTQLTGTKNLTQKVQQWIKDLGYEVPQSPEGKINLGKELEPYSNMLGNQALLYYKSNRVAKNSPLNQMQTFNTDQAL